MSSKSYLQMKMKEEEEVDGLFGILTGQSVLIEKLLFATLNQTRMTVIAQEQTVWIVGNGEAWEWPEASSW